jgi:4-amino-4-deoxy-L-arabinose transferase-like glycosyltransferase
MFAGALAFLAVVAGVLATGAYRGDFRIDEAYKISETPFLGLWLDGDFSNPTWFANIVDRINPPVGKYAFGAAIVASGQALPTFPTLAVRDPSIPQLHAPALSEPYRPMLIAVRFVSVIATALTAALLAMILARHHGWISATCAVALFALNFVTRSYEATAVFDPLMTLFFTTSIVLMAVLIATTTPKRLVLTSIAIGIVTALAFQTRLNGLYAFVVALPFLWFALRRKAILASAFTIGAFVVTVLIVNPYYWSTPAIPHEPFSSHAGPLRPIARLVQQKHDLDTVAAPALGSRTEGRTLGGKTRYLFEMMLSERSGILLILGAITGVILLFARWSSLAHPIRAAVLMSLAIVATMVATLPMPWARYLLVDVPPLALIAGFAIGELTAIAR